MSGTSWTSRRSRGKDHYLGTSVRRAEDERLLAGRGRFGDDLAGEAHHVHFVRAPLARALVRHIDTSAALAMEGVLLVAGWSDLPPSLRAPLPVLFGHPALEQPVTQPALARDEVCYAGQPVVAVVARDRYIAEDAADAVRIDYEPLDPVVGLTAAVAGDFPAAHTGRASGVAAVVSEETGAVDEALRDAPRVLRRAFDVERSAGLPMEGRVVSARFAEGLLHVRDTTQSPTSIQMGLADLLGLAPHDVRVTTGDIGGSFGAKGVYFYPEEVVVPWLAVHTGVPVKWTEDRREHFEATAHERGQHHEVTVGYDDDGRLRALVTDFCHDMGASAQYGLIVPMVTASQLPGMYRLPHYRYTFTGVHTNTVPVAPYRGAGRPQAVFVMERVMDLIALDVGVDPVEVRRRNLIPPDDFPYSVGVTYQDGFPATYDSGDFPALLDRLEDVALGELRSLRDEGRRAGRPRGLGVATYVEGTGLGPYESASVSVGPHGEVTVEVALSSQGQGHETVLGQVVADRLRVPLGAVRVRGGDTAARLSSTGAYASRTAVLAANAAVDAADAVAERAIGLAARCMELPPDRLVLDGGFVVCIDDPARHISLGDLARIADPAAFSVGESASRITALRALAHRPGPPAPHAPGDSPTELRAARTVAASRGAWGSGAHAVLVDVDPRTFAVTVLRYVVVHDCGVILNPRIVEGQIIGGVAQGLGGALYERMEYDAAGRLLNSGPRTFHLPGPADLPDIEVHHICTPSTMNALGAKGVGEAGTVPVPAAVANAVSDALRVAVDRAPIFPAHLQRLRESAGSTLSAPSQHWEPAYSRG
ncbi:molybdopterin cofactor-binding domain-containing protein [Streptomyces sp. NPDC057509]|uniref:molybdopterin cofactor-binding domain-containing protein n=1 Tax=Streptomyces sp. NPDC057509 TaxID=3346152 RepID=UPI0036799CA4